VAGALLSAAVSGDVALCYCFTVKPTLKQLGGVQEIPIPQDAAELDQKLPDGYRGTLAPALPGALIQPFTIPREAPPPAAKVRRALHDAAACLRWWAHAHSDAEPTPRRSLLALLERMHGPSLQPEGAPGTVPMHGNGIMMGAGIPVDPLRRDAQAVSAMLVERSAMANSWTHEIHERCDFWSSIAAKGAKPLMIP
jgi:hypothetical protein